MELNKTFKDGLWSKEINVRDFVSNNITPYEGDASFLQGPTERTKAVWNHCLKALEEERNNNGIRALDYTTVSTITSHPAGYIDKENELIVGLQTDQVLKRAIKPFGGINVVMKACRENGVEVDDRVKDIFTHYRKTHNDGYSMCIPKKFVRSVHWDSLPDFPTTMHADVSSVIIAAWLSMVLTV